MNGKTPLTGIDYQLPHLGPGAEAQQQQAKFDRNELAIVLSHYDVGVLKSAKSFSRGSRRAPKARIVSESGNYLLKRRAVGQDDPQRVRFAHKLQAHLAAKGFPVAPLISTRRSKTTTLELDGRVYELFEFVPGRRFDNTKNDAWEAGAVLGQLHHILNSVKIKYCPPLSSFHAVKGINNKIKQIPSVVEVVEKTENKESLEECCTFLRRAYRDATNKTEKLGFSDWESTYLHGDWHPGNLLFSGNVISSVLDFDCARREPRIVEFANAILQFSMCMGSTQSLQSWPKGLNVSFIEAIATGYQAASGKALSPAECHAIPWLMIEAIIAESVYPIAAAGTFGRLRGSDFLSVVTEKVRWIRRRATSLVELLETS
ncbi:MAG: phosphotransferase [Phycisphaerales bacterium]|nr:phosphotransferase [Phycisphaerales bacterium]